MEGARFHRQPTESYLQALRNSRPPGVGSCSRRMTTVMRRGRELPAKLWAELLPRLPAAATEVKRVCALPAIADRRLVLLRQLPEGAGRSKFESTREGRDNCPLPGATAPRPRGPFSPVRDSRFGRPRRTRRLLGDRVSSVCRYGSTISGLFAAVVSGAEGYQRGSASLRVNARLRGLGSLPSSASVLNPVLGLPWHH